MDKTYYMEMLRKERLMPIVIGDRFAALLTFYITNDETKYIEADPWDVLDDDNNGSVCYIAQMLTDKMKENPKLSYSAWKTFKNYIKKNFSNVRYIHWRRWDKKNLIVKTYKKEI